MSEHFDALAAFLVAILGATGVFLYRLRQGKALTATAGASAHRDHAAAEIKEAKARLSLDDATREWAEKLIARYDAENAELRAEIKEARELCRAERVAIEEAHRREIAELLERHNHERLAWGQEVEALRKELDQVRQEMEDLRLENVLLRLHLERNGISVGTGPLSISGDVDDYARNLPDGD